MTTDDENDYDLLLTYYVQNTTLYDHHNEETNNDDDDDDAWLGRFMLILVLKQAPHVYALPCIKIEHPQQTADELLFLTKYLLRSYIKLTLTAEVKEVGGRNETTAASRQLKLKTDFSSLYHFLLSLV
ncbi:hypothetical protein GQX74_015509 [Glossina fuscipes]|nr:hypothetical protein GQX74_015509 [Glossina fuscipes]